MKFNVKPSDAHYIVDADKKVVVCVINDTERLFLDFAHKNFVIAPDCDSEWTRSNTNSYFYSRLYKKLLMPRRFTGVAKCSKDDEWNLETGKLIAFSRAKDNLNKSFFKRANTYINYLDRYVNEATDTLNALGEKLTINSKHRHNLINDILGPDENT